MNVRRDDGAAVRRLLLVGPPNAGKSTLFNRLTGGSASVGNYAGTTVSVERGLHRTPSGDGVEVVDLPGVVSLAAGSPEERVTLRALLTHLRDDGGGGTVVVFVGDAPRLARSLYLALQVRALDLPMVCALNLADEAERAGRLPSAEAVAEVLGVPTVLISARRGEGLAALDGAIRRAAEEAPGPAPDVGWPAELLEDVAAVTDALPDWARAPDRPAREAAVARWALLSPRALGDAPALEAAVASRRGAAEAAGRDLDAEVVGARYAWIDARLPTLIPSPEGAAADDAPRRLTDALDRVLMHPLLGAGVFLLVMGLVFSALFSWADPAIGAIEGVQGWLGDAVGGAFGADPSPALAVVRDLIVDGLIGGVGAVLVFLPQIALLFLFLSLLEDCGYLARAAHLTDRLLRAAGLPGKAFVPLLSGYACAVPAILATRTLPRARDRLLANLVLPLTSCSARLPVYTLMIGALFPATVTAVGLPLRPLALLGMYLFSTLVTVLAAIVLGRLLMPAEASATVLELPPYRWPDARNVARTVWARSMDFVREAGQVILVATVVLWALLSFPRHAPEDVLPEAVLGPAIAHGLDLDEVARPYQLERSYAGQLGHAIEPVVAPLGMDWRIGVGLIGSFAAREVFVSTMGVVFGVGDADEEDAGLRAAMRDARRPDGSALFTPRTGLSVMVFFALAMQCLSTLAVLKKETGGWRWPAFVVAYMTALAWVGSFLTWHGAGWLGIP